MSHGSTRRGPSFAGLRTLRCFFARFHCTFGMLLLEVRRMADVCVTISFTFAPGERTYTRITQRFHPSRRLNTSRVSLRPGNSDFCMEHLKGKQLEERTLPLIINVRPTVSEVSIYRYGRTTTRTVVRRDTYRTRDSWK